MKRRILSVLLTLCVVAFLLPFAIFAAEDAASITGFAVTVDGVTYTEGNVAIKPNSTILYTVTGTNLDKLAGEFSLEHAPNIKSYIGYGYGWDIDDTNTSATRDFSDRIAQFLRCEKFELVYSHASGEQVHTGIYLTYDDGSTEADKAEITGISLVVDGVTYTEGHVSVKPESEVILIVHGNYLRKADENLILDTPGVYVYVERMTLETNERCSQTAIGTWFEGGVDYPITYTNDGWATTKDSGITVTCESIVDDTPAEITDIAIMVDGVTYTEGDVLVKPDSTVSFIVTGINLLNVDQTQIIDTPLAYLPLHSIPLQEDGTYLYTTYASVFEGAKRYQITYTNDSWANTVATDIFVTYKDHDCQESQWIIELAPTCAESGSKYTECLICHERIKQEEIPATGEHSWDEGTVTKEATCTETGVRSFTCAVCGGSYTEEILELGHSYSATATAPTCADDGYTTYACYCGDTYVADEVDALGHSYVDGVCAVCGGDDPNYIPPVEPSEPGETEIETPAEDNFFIAFIHAIIAFLKQLFRMK